MGATSAEHRYIAIDGPPGAGVSALAAHLAARTGALLVTDPAHQSPFRADYARQPERYAFQAQTHCLLARHRQQVELAQPQLFHPRGVVSDYAFLRDDVFARSILEPVEYRLYGQIYDHLRGQLRPPDLLVYLTADREVLRSRLKRLVPSADRVIKLNVLDTLTSHMDEAVLTYDQGPVLAMNTSEFDFVERPEHLEDLTDLIVNTRGGVRHVRPVSMGLF